jgi:diguanylate cyclase (GGDEF)-like protein
MLLKHVLQNIREAVLFISNHQKILAWNRAAESLIGINFYVQADVDWLFGHMRVEPRNGRNLSNSDLSVRDAILGQRELVQYATITIEDRTAPVDLQVIPLIGARGNCLGSLLMLHDATYKVNLQQQVQELMAKTISDPLTGVANRAEFERILETCCQHYKAAGRELSLIICDIDHFKSINDNFGHATGDEALVTFAKYLQRSIRDADLVARYGGEEFVIVCNDCNGEAAVDCAEKIRKRLEKSPLGCLGQKTLSASFGVAQFHAGDTPASLFNRADQALLRAKESGRNRVIFGELADCGETKFVNKGNSKVIWQATDDAIICQQYTTSSPIEVLGAKLEGFVIEQQARFNIVQPNRVEIQTTDEAVGLFRRSNDRRVGFKVDLQFKEICEHQDGSRKFGPRSLIQISIGALRPRDRRQADIRQQAEVLLRSLCSYLMLSPLQAAEPSPDRSRR